MILDLSTWWQALDNFEKIYWTIALLFSALFLVQTIISFSAGDMDGDAIGDADDFVGEDPGIGTQFFTFKSMVAFFTMFGWTGVAGTNAGWSEWLTLIIAVSAGVLMVAILAVLVKKIMQLQQSGTMDINNAVGKMGTVYLPVPGQKKGTGKVQLKVQGSIHELDAITEDSEDIPTGRLIKVTQIIGNEMLQVTTDI